MGLRTYGEETGNPFLGRDIAYGRDYSEDAAKLIDREVREILDRNYNRAKQIILDNKEKLIELAQRLIEVETLDCKEFEALMESEPTPPESSPEPVIA